jgi:nicotinamide-nucleotide amidase
MPSQIVQSCSRAIAAKNMNIFFAESATAGRMCSEFSLCPESRNILRGGIVCHDVFIKGQILKVPHKLMATYSTESNDVTKSIAQNAHKLFNAKITVAVTGLITPGESESPNKPVGTTYLYIITPGGEIAHREVFPGTPEEIILRTTDRVAGLIIELLNNKIKML